MKEIEECPYTRSQFADFPAVINARLEWYKTKYEELCSRIPEPMECLRSSSDDQHPLDNQLQKSYIKGFNACLSIIKGTK